MFCSDQTQLINWFNFTDGGLFWDLSSGSHLLETKEESEPTAAEHPEQNQSIMNNNHNINMSASQWAAVNGLKHQIGIKPV